MINHEMFNSIDENEKIKILESIREVKLKKGDYLFWQDDPAAHVYYVKSGHMKVFKTSVNGNETIFDIYDANSFVALGVLFNDPQKYPASCSAVSSSVVYALPTKVIEDAIVANPTSARLWISYMNKRLTMVQRKLSEQIFSDSTERFRNLIRYFLKKYPNKINGDYIHISVPITKQELADILNVRRETLSRLLSSLKELQLCEMTHQEIIVHKAWINKK